MAPMAYASCEDTMARQYGFSDLHSFKDDVGSVKLCAPDEFPIEEWAGPDDQMTLDRHSRACVLG